MKKKSILPFVSKPGRYVGGEVNIVEKDWGQTAVHFALVFPDLYEIGMSHMGLQILYHILNNEDDVCAERCYCPDLDAERIMLAQHLPLTTLESATPLSAFDVVGFTLPYELCYTNILTILNLAKIPFYSRKRSDSHPIIIGGGACSLNPEPVADFFDAIVLGDGEEVIVEIAHIMQKAKKYTMDKANVIHRLGEIDGIYIPANFSPSYDSDNKILEITALPNQAHNVQRRIIRDIDTIDHLKRPIVPNAKIIHDRLGVEIARGCSRGCRFCQAGMIYRPVRERGIEQILELATRGIENTGFEELALLSLSTGDHSCIDRLLPQLMDQFAKDRVSISMPSMRVGTLSQPVMEQIKRVRKTGFTVAPEAGSERLRRFINKGITEEDLLKTCADAFALGWSTLKLYFMIGLPTETLEDVGNIALLVEKTREITKKPVGKRKQINVSVGTFVPKAHTPFQWEAQLSLAESKKRIGHLRASMPRKGVKFKWHDPGMSLLEGIFARGDRKLAVVVEKAWSGGARLDGWSDHFSLATWLDAAQKCDINLDSYLRARNFDEILPWSHLCCGVDVGFLQNELKKAHQQTYTPDCRYHGCQHCGLCDFKTIMPIVNPKSTTEQNGRELPALTLDDQSNQPSTNHYKYMVNYSRSGNICFLSHLEILQLLFRAVRRAKIRPHFSKGFNPSPKISFAGALPVGMESKAEFFIIDLPEQFENIEKVENALNKSLPHGLTVTGIKRHSGQIPQSIVNDYEIRMERDISDSEKNAIARFLAAQDSFITRTRKAKTKTLDIRPLVKDLSIYDSTTLHLRMVSSVGVAGVKIPQLLSHIFSWEDESIVTLKITKTSWEPLQRA